MATFALLAPGCGGDDAMGDDDDDVVADGGGAGDPDAFVPPGDSFSVQWGPLTIPAGTEDTKCVIKRLGNAEELRAHQIHNVLGDVSHHFIVYKSNATTESPEPFSCQPFSDTLNPDEGGPLMITQKYEETLTLPDGVAFVLEPNQMIRLELHYINASDQDKEVTATSTFVPIADGAFEHEADLLFMGDVDISLPPNSAGSLGPTYIPVPAELNGANFFAITGHVHQWGTNVVVETASGQDAPVETVYDVPNFDWDEPETVRYAPPFTHPDNGGFRITCEWFNGSDSNVGFGEGANDEMCFFWAYYYPSNGAKVCFAHSGLGITGCCPESFYCSQL